MKATKYPMTRRAPILSGFMERLNALALLSVLAATLFAGCADRVDGPEALQVADALEPSLTLSPTAQDRRFWERMGIWDHAMWPLREASTAVLHRDGQASSYRAVVFERVMVPPSGLDQGACLGTRRTAFLWRDDEGQRDGLVFTGGEFDRRLVARREPCPGLKFAGPAPTLSILPSQDDTQQRSWLSTDGEGDISPGEVVGECAFLTSEAVHLLREAHGITCHVTRHRVRFLAEARQLAPSRTAPVPLVFEPGSMGVELQPTEILGFRYTIDCDATPLAAERCDARL